LTGRYLKATVLLRRRAILRQARLVGVERVWLVGSVARAQANGQSDIDLLIETDNSFDHFLLQQWWSATLGWPIDIIHPSAICSHPDPQFGADVLRDAIALHTGAVLPPIVGVKVTKVDDHSGLVRTPTCASRGPRGSSPVGSIL